MRILLICGYFPTKESDDPLMPAHTELAQALVKLGHQVCVISFSDVFDNFAGDGHYELWGIEVFQLRPSFERYRTWSSGLQLNEFTRVTAEAHQMHAKMNSIVQNFKPDVIDCQEFNGLAFFFAQEHRYPLTVHCYGPLAHLMRSGELGNVHHLDTELVDIFELAGIAEADGLIACSEDVAKKHSYRSGRPLSDFSIIKVPLSPAASLPEASKRINDAFPRLFFFGRVDPLKGASLLMDSIPIIAKKFPNFELVIAGGEPPQPGRDKKYADEMREKLTEIGLRDRVKFLGRVSRPEIKQNVVDSDVCIFPSKYETAGYACLEAISYGGAVVATAVGGLPEYHSHEHSLFLVPPNSGSELAAGVIKVAEDNVLRQKLKTDGASYVLSECNPERIAHQTVAAYSKAIEKFEQSTSPNYSFKVMSKMITTLIEQTAPVGPAGHAAPPPVAAKPKSAPPAPVPAEGVVTSLSIVQNLGDMVLGHLSRVWKEGYDAGFEEGAKHHNKTVTAKRGMRSLLSAAARRVKNGLEN